MIIICLNRSPHGINDPRRKFRRQTAINDNGFRVQKRLCAHGCKCNLRCLLALTVIAAIAIFKTTRVLTFVLTAAFVAMILPVSLMGYQVTAPFLVLGATALLGSAFVHSLFANARALDVNAG